MTSFTLFGLALAPLYAAIAEVESGNGETSPNVYQIDEDGHGYTADVNRIMRIRAEKVCSTSYKKIRTFTNMKVYTPKDALIRSEAEYMMGVYWSYYGEHYQKTTGRPVTYEVLARIHNGGPNGWMKKSTLAYWEKVKAVMLRNRHRL